MNDDELSLSMNLGMLIMGMLIESNLERVIEKCATLVHPRTSVSSAMSIGLVNDRWLMEK